MKHCRKCGNEYEPSQRDLSKHDYQCRPCRREHDRQYRLSRKLAGNPVVSGKMPREWHRKYEASYFSCAENRIARNANSQRYRKRQDLYHKHSARRAVRHAVASGVIKRNPCEVCGAKTVDGHHDDYSRPLDVRWLCRTHHAEHHAKARGQQ